MSPKIAQAARPVRPAGPDLELLESGEVIIRTRAAQYLLGRPTLGEYRELMQAIGQADDEVNAAVAALPEAERGEGYGRVLFAEAGPYQKAVAFVIVTLAYDPPGEIDPESLPAWAARPEALIEMAAHWRAVPLGRSGRDAAR